MEAVISDKLFQSMMFQGNQSPTEEICGALLGTRNGEVIKIHKYVPLTNTSDNKPVHYRPDPNEWLTVLMQTRLNKDAKYDLVGIYHTHPKHPPIASHTDIEEAGYEGIYIIYSPSYNSHRAYYYDGDEDKRQFELAQLKIGGKNEKT